MTAAAGFGQAAQAISTCRQHVFSSSGSSQPQQLAWQPAPQPARPAGRAGQQRGRPSPRLRSLSFMGSLDMPSLMPGWLLPSWLTSNDYDDVDEGVRAAVRQRRLNQLRRLLTDSRRQPALLLPPSPDDALGGGAADEGLDVSHSASNAVPFYPGPGGAMVPCSSATATALGGAAAAACRAEEATQVLPWLYAVSGRLDFSAMEALASQLALSGLQLLDVTRYAATAAAAAYSLPSNVRWAGLQPMPSPAVAAAAALRRMELRRGGALRELPETEGKAVVLAYHPHHRQLAAEVLALYFHAYLGLSGQEAVQAAGTAVGTSPLEPTLRQSMEELATLADGWRRRVTLAWPYAGGHVEIVGDAVGGWDQRVPMVFDVEQRRWRLVIWGLPPGVHRFKYIVDGCWVIDLAAHTEADSRGNINNVVLVSGSRQPEMRQRPRQRRTQGADASNGNGNGAAASAAVPDGKTKKQHQQQQHVAAASAEPMVQAVQQPSEQEAGSKVDTPQQQGQGQVLPPWGSVEEMERMALFGAALLAYHTRLGLQLRHVLH